MNSTVEKWGIFELQLCSKINYNNPFTDVKLKACFYNSGCKKVVHGFYDGDGIYKIRFMPEFEGEYSYTVFSNDPDMNNISGTFTVTPPSENNHGPVKATGEHFTYADGTPFLSWERLRMHGITGLQKYGKERCAVSRSMVSTK